jgi:predicted MFS family arabinose efflux permease
VGALLGGFLAKEFGYNSVNWMAAIAGAGSFATLFLWLRPVEKQRAEHELEPEPASNGGGA